MQNKQDPTFDGTLGGLQLMAVGMVADDMAEVFHRNPAKPQASLNYEREAAIKQKTDIETIQEILTQAKGKTLAQLAKITRDHKTVSKYKDLASGKQNYPLMQEFNQKHGPLMMYFLAILAHEDVEDEGVTQMCELGDRLNEENYKNTMKQKQPVEKQGGGTIIQTLQNWSEYLQSTTNSPLLSNIRHAVSASARTAQVPMEPMTLTSPYAGGYW